MHTIPLPDSLFAKAEQAAAASGRSVELYVQEAVALQLEEDVPIRLTPEQVAKITQAEAEIDAGEFFTSEEVRAYFGQKKSA